MARGTFPTRSGHYWGPPDTASASVKVPEDGSTISQVCQVMSENKSAHCVCCCCEGSLRVPKSVGVDRHALYVLLSWLATTTWPWTTTNYIVINGIWHVGVWEKCLWVYLWIKPVVVAAAGIIDAKNCCMPIKFGKTKLHSIRLISSVPKKLFSPNYRHATK